MTIDIETLKFFSRQHGMSILGITTPEIYQGKEIYMEWINAGFHGEMAYLARESAIQKRLIPTLHLSGCKSILVLGLPYPYSETSPHSKEPCMGQVAAYAWGQDYHDIFPNLLQEFIQHLQDAIRNHFQYKIFTDSSPILERSLGSQAGLGWIGKNSCLIHPQHGSTFFLGEIFIEYSLPTTPFSDQDLCGSCQCCVEACPTQCILPNRTLDARKCISYLTIENKSSIPRELRSRVGNWVFGCDICQQVCPWNKRFADRPGSPALAPYHKKNIFPLSDVFKLDNREFKVLFHLSPILRARRNGLLRNAAVVLGNQGSDDDLKVLNEVLQYEPVPMIREHAAWAIGQIGGPIALEMLNRARQSEMDPIVQSEIQLCLNS